MSTNKIPNNQFQQGLTVRGGINADSLVVNGVSITNSGGAVTVVTDVNNNSATNVPSTSVTHSLKQTNDTQTTQINTNTTTLAAIQAQLENLYGTSLASWAGLGLVATASSATYLQKSGGTMTGTLTLGTNDIGSVRDIKFSNALLGGTIANVYAWNFIGNHWGDGSQLTNLNLTTAANFGTASATTVVVGAPTKFLNFQGILGSDLTLSSTKSISGGQDLRCSNAVITSNVYCGNVFASGNVSCGAGSFFLGDGSRLTGITATGADASASLNFATSGALATPIGLTSVYGSGLNYGGFVRIGGTIVDNSPTVTINAGPSLTGQAEAVTLNSTVGNLQLNNLWDKPVFIGKEGSGSTSSVTINGGSLVCNHTNTINPIGTHTPRQVGLVQTMVIPLSGEQGPISQTVGAGVLPWVMYRAPFKMMIHGVRLHCAQTSSSGVVQIDIRRYSQGTVPTGANMNSTTGTSIFSTLLQIDVGLYSSFGSTAVATNGTLNVNNSMVLDDALIGIFITQPGTNVLGLKATVYFSYTQ